MSNIKLDLVGCISILEHFYYGDLTLCHRHLCLLTNALQLEPGPDLQLRGRMGELFRNVISLSSLAVCVDSNRGWFIPNLLFERVVIDRSFADGFGSGNDDDDNDDDGSESSERVSRAEESEYGEEEELL